MQTNANHKVLGNFVRPILGGQLGRMLAAHSALRDHVLMSHAFLHHLTPRMLTIRASTVAPGSPSFVSGTTVQEVQEDRRQVVLHVPVYRHALGLHIHILSSILQRRRADVTEHLAEPASG